MTFPTHRLAALGLATGTALAAYGNASAGVLGYDITSIVFTGVAEDPAITETSFTVVIDDAAPPTRFSLNDGEMNTFDGAFLYTPEDDVNDDVADDLNPNQDLTVDITFSSPNGAGTVQLTGRTIGLITTQSTPLGPQPFERGLVEFDAPVIVNVPGGRFQIEGIDTEFNRGIEVLGAFTGLSQDTSGAAFGATVPIKITQLEIPEPASLLLFAPAVIALTTRERRAQTAPAAGRDF
ncbi:MAG: hypothetical protein AAF288_12830 [Planctomycetota bacterium]